MNETKAAYSGKCYFVRKMENGDRVGAVDLLVDDSDYVELLHWRWYGREDPHRPYNLSQSRDKSLWDAKTEVWQWLVEEELVQLRPIGREDSEYFATPKLRETENESPWRLV